MAKIINISDKLNNEKSKIVVGTKEYAVNDGIATVTKFEEMAATNSVSKITEAIKLAIGDKAAKELKVDEMSVGNMKVLMIAIFAAMLDIEYDDAEARFRKAEGK
ncbi:MAG: hypothetical protein N3B21_19290 [Clostridia bacterium]|nr:hypothetical protein [Clostridia bacterium]